MRHAPTSRCTKCGSRLFYQDPSTGDYFCGGHEPPRSASKQQYFILKSATKGEDMSKLAEVDWAKVAKSVRQRTGHHITATEVQSIAEKAASDAAAETIVESHLPHQSMADVVKSMTTSGIEVREQSDRFLSEDRDMYGRAEKREQESEEEDETVRDFYGRNRRRK